MGAVLATAFWEALQFAGTWYVTRGLQHAGPTYGFLAVVITLLSWLYLGSGLTLWAAEINVVLRYRLAGMEVRRPEEKVAASFTTDADGDPLGDEGSLGSVP